MADQDELERKIAALLAEHVAVGYELGPDGLVNPDTIHLSTAGAAHVVVHELRKEFSK